MARGIRQIVRPRWFRWRVVALIVALAVLPFAAFEGYRAWLRTDPEWRFVEEVLLRQDFNDEQVIIRWATSPAVALFNATEEDEATVRELLGDFNDVLRDSGIAVRLGARGQSQIQIIFAPRNTHRELAEELRKNYKPDAAAMVWYWVDDESRTYRAVVAVASELEERQRRTAIAHEFAHAMGLMNHTKNFPDSIILDDRLENVSATTLAPIDRRLLRLLYMHLKPGYGWLETRSAYRAFWAD